MDFENLKIGKSEVCVRFEIEQEPGYIAQAEIESVLYHGKDIYARLSDAAMMELAKKCLEAVRE